MEQVLIEIFYITCFIALGWAGCTIADAIMEDIQK